MTAYAFVIVANGEDPNELWEELSCRLPLPVRFIGDPWQVNQRTDDAYDTDTAINERTN